MHLIKKEHELFYILLVLALVYFSFVNKAFTVDDTLFIKAAEQILIDPADFYGGTVNWYGTPDPHFQINQNPPLAAFMIALVASVFGFEEIALHSFFFLPLVLSAIGIYLLGRHFNTSPLYTTVLAVFTPVFLVHGTNVMSDSTLLMFWVWGLVFWLNGTKTNSPFWFLAAGMAVALGALTKYTCIFLLPLFVFSGIWKFKRHGWWMVAVLIPVAFLAAYEYYTKSVYGKGLFLEAIFYANTLAPRSVEDYFDSTLVGLSFLGGCFPVALLLMPLTSRNTLRIPLLFIAAGIVALVFAKGQIESHTFLAEGNVDLSLVTQFCAFSLAGISLLLATLKEFKKGLSHDAVFLLLWFFGIFVFVCYLNWTVNARSFILLVPVAGILLARRIEEWLVQNHNLKQLALHAVIGIAAMVAVAVTYADYQWANTGRKAAGEIAPKYKRLGKVLFQGHWGFQYYMEREGIEPVNFNRNDIYSGEYVVVPVNNTNVIPPDFRFELTEIIQIPFRSPIATMALPHAGFYASVWSPIPYGVNKSRQETYLVYRKK